MTSSYVGEIRMFAGNFAPVDWAFCDGRLLPISDYQALYTLIGKMYGGDQTRFALPDLRGRVPIHQGGGFAISQPGGTETVTLTSTQVPVHSHQFLCSTSAGNQRDPTGTVLAVATGNAYNQLPPDAQLAASSIGSSPGGGQPHDNMQPYLCVSFIISLHGIFPSKT